MIKTAMQLKAKSRKRKTKEKRRKGVFRRFRRIQMGRRPQFFKLCSGAGIRPPRPIMTAGDSLRSGMTGP